MSLVYFNPKRQNDEVENKFQKILPLFDQLNNNDDKLFIILTHIGCLINIFYRKRTFSTTDCCTTSESIWNLFDPKNEKEFTIETSADLMILLNDKSYNIFNFRILGLTFHNFTIVQHNNNWYLLQSYVNICELNVVKDNHLPIYLNKLLDTGDVSIYNKLFKSDLPYKNKTNKIYYNISAGHFDSLPDEVLKDLIRDYKM